MKPESSQILTEYTSEDRVTHDLGDEMDEALLKSVTPSVKEDLFDVALRECWQKKRANAEAAAAAAAEEAKKSALKKDESKHLL